MEYNAIAAPEQQPATAPNPPHIAPVVGRIEPAPGRALPAKPSMMTKEESLEALQGILAKARENSGHLFGKTILCALASLQYHDADAFTMLLAELRQIRFVSIRDVKAAVLKTRRQMDIEDEDFGGIRFLGSRNSAHYYLSGRTGNLVAIETAAHGHIGNLLGLADHEFWVKKFPSGRRFDIPTAVDWLLRMSDRFGPFFNPARLRGRGAWLDKGRVVFNLGNAIQVNGVEAPPSEFANSEFVYNAGEALNLRPSTPLEKERAKLILDACYLLRWEDPIFALLLAGWIVTAPVCGAMPWRSHAWLTGGAGSGKSWVLRNLVQKLLGDFAVNVQSATTEAGLRQTLGSDALPVVFDEIESENERAKNRVQLVLELMRQASSENGAPIVKGSAGQHQGFSYLIRSQFLLASVGVHLVRQSDQSRVSVLSLREPAIEKAARAREDAKFEQLQELVDRFDDDFVAAFHARCLSMLPTLRHNVDVMRNAVTKRLISRRFGDQVGVLLAGAYSLLHDDALTNEAANAWLDENNIDETAQSRVIDEFERDEIRLLRTLVDQTVAVDAIGTGGRLHVTVRELVLCAKNGGLGYMPELSEAKSTETLARTGIRVRTEKDGTNYLWVANSAFGIKRLLSNTPWSVNWKQFLKRIPNSREEKISMLGAKNNSIGIPLSMLGDL